MISIGSNGNKIAYGIKHYNLDTDEDLINLPTHREAMGCTCFVIETSKYYMLNSNLKWVEITPFGKVISSGGDGGSGEEDDVPSTPGDIIYEGGVV